MKGKYSLRNMNFTDQTALFIEIIIPRVDFLKWNPDLGKQQGMSAKSILTEAKQ